MYDNWQDLWSNWTRSLPMHDRFSGPYTALGWLEVACVQALPLPLLLSMLISRKAERGLLLLNSILVATRLGVLIGTAHTYQQRPWSYWLSPLCDLPVAFQLGKMALKRNHSWRGRVIIRKEEAGRS